MGLTLRFNFIASTVGVGNGTVSDPAGPVNGFCAIDQMVLLWIAVVMVSVACFVSSFIGDSMVQYATTVTGNFPWLAKVFPPHVAHAILATSALLVIILIDQAIFQCLTGVILDAVIVRSVPIVTGTLLVTVYGFLFSLPAGGVIIGSNSQA